MRKTLLAAVVAALSAAVAAPAFAQAAAPAANKKALIAKVLELQKPGIEGMARQLAEQPAAQLLQQAGAALQRIPADKRETLAKELEADARKYADETTPFVRERALKLAPEAIGTLLEEKMSEAELKQVIAMLESPAVKKYNGLMGDMQRVLVSKVVADTRATVDPKVRALEQSMSRRLSAATAPPSPPTSAPAAAPAASARN